jgi:hypothetical protein
MRDGIFHFDTNRNYDARPADIKDVVFMKSPTTNSRPVQNRTFKLQH